MRLARLRAFLILLASIMLLVACRPVPTPVPAPTLTPTPASQPADIRRLTILYTNDEHGWIASLPQKDGSKLGGAAELLGRWRQTESYTAAGPFLVLSGGDMWTGPAISSWFNGDSAAEMMNLLGYRAAAIGNHEFDFGVETLRRHAREAKFPFLSANLVRKGTTEPPDFAQPFTVIEVGGVKVGVIGLSTTLTPQVTNPQNVADFEFLPYADALRRTIPQVKAAGADLVVILAHVCSLEMRELAPTARDLGADVLTAGHCHELVAEEATGLSLIGSGQFWQSYTRLTLELDLTNHRVVSRRVALVSNKTETDGTPAADEAVAGRVAHWQAQTDKALGEVIGYTATGLAHRSDALMNLVTDAWLWAYGTANAAVINRGSFRQAIDAGPLTLGDIVGVLPFNNTIVDVAVTGAQLQENLVCCGGALGGIRYRNGKVTTPAGEPLDPQKTYHVLINDFMAGGGDKYLFGKQDPPAYFTAIDWRQPVIDYVKQLGTSEAKPLETLLDPAPR